MKLRSAHRTVGLSLIALLVLVALNPRTTVDSCGVTVHNEIAFRASRILLAQDHPAFTSCSCPRAHLGQHSASCAHSLPDKPVKSQPKAINDFAPLLAHKELLFAGSFFPDWGYNCIGKMWNDAAEQVHCHTQQISCMIACRSFMYNYTICKGKNCRVLRATLSVNPGVVVFSCSVTDSVSYSAS